MQPLRMSYCQGGSTKMFAEQAAQMSTRHAEAVRKNFYIPVIQCAI
jgi:hypothetical protein